MCCLLGIQYLDSCMRYITAVIHLPRTVVSMTVCSHPVSSTFFLICLVLIILSVRDSKVRRWCVLGSLKSADAAKRTVEESCTVAEQMARGKDPQSGYYQYIKVKDKKTNRWRYPYPEEAQQMMDEDRMLFTNGTGRPLSGKSAINSVNNNWIKSHISRLHFGRAKLTARDYVQQLNS